MSTVENSPILNEVNYYRILSISNTSTLVEIRNAYEKKLEEVHLEAIAAYSLFPEEETEQQLLKYGQAYVTLANPIARAKYDNELKLTGIGTLESDFEEESTGISESPLAKKNEQKKTRSLLNKLNVKFEKPSQKIDELSGGNQQKMLVARWLNTDARVWLLDEPTRGVDVGSKVSLHNQLKELAGTGKALIVASSDLDELMKICDRILVLSKKRFTSMLHPDQWSKRKILDAAFNLLETSEHQSVGTNMTKTN